VNCAIRYDELDERARILPGERGELCVDLGGTLAVASREEPVRV